MRIKDGADALFHMGRSGSQGDLGGADASLAMVRPLAIALVVPDRARLDSGAMRLAGQILGDPRYRLAAIQSAAHLPSRTDRILDLEARFLPRLSYVPEPELSAALARTPDTIKSADVIIDLSGAPDVAELAGGALHGVWRLSSYCGDAGLAALSRGETQATVTLSRQTDRHAPVPIARATFGTKVAASRTREFLRDKSGQLVWQTLARLSQGEDLRPVENAPDPVARRVRYPLRLAETLARRGGMWLEERLGGTPGRFVLLLGAGDPLTFDPAALTEIAAPKGQFWADPFLFQNGDDLWLFYEDFLQSTGRGQIGVARVEGTRVTPVGVARDGPHHLSFPFVFAEAGEFYMMAETHQTGRLEIWRATDFPFGWTLHSTALEGLKPADIALFKHRGDWWIFTNLTNDRFGDYSSELHLYRTSGPDLAWTEPHPLNPVVVDAGTARGGGRVFERDGRIYRVSQDNTGPIYGYGINVMEITRLDRTGYAERRQRHILPDFKPGFIGCHHMDFAGGTVVMDARRRR